MVLYKRKPVGVIPPPEGLTDTQEVWPLEATGEVFVDYESFLNRMDFLTQPRFTDAVNGKSGLTYFAAVKSEAQSSTAIDNVFPEVLRDPILRKVQFSEIGRMDDLVNMVYDEFKHDFFPGEEIDVLLDTNNTPRGIIREKAKFPKICGPDGTIQREAFSRYFIRLPATPDKEALVDELHIRRDKKIFTKQNVRSFLKNSLQREAWTGAPWLVKEHLAVQYRLPMEIPQHLLQDFKVMQAKQQQSMGKATKGRRKAHEVPRASIEDLRLQQQLQQSAMSQSHALPGQYVHQPHARTNGAQTYYRAAESATMDTKSQAPVIKYPMEDLDLPPKQNGVTRPELRFFTSEMNEYIRNGRVTPPREIRLETLSMMLETWNTLNVQCEVYRLDSFTFDDFCDAMNYTSDSSECELLCEVFCAVLTLLVTADGKPQIALPQIVEEESDETEDSITSTAPATPAEESAPPARSTRSTRVGDASDLIDAAAPIPISHRAAEAIEEHAWKDRIAKRDFEDGGWQIALVGLLYRLSHGPEYKGKVEPILEYLVPLDDEPTRDNVQQHFSTMDVNLKVMALQIITFLSISTRSIKVFLEDCSDDQTDVRKRKVEFQKERKLYLEVLSQKNRERKILLPDNMPDTPEPEEPEVDLTASTDIDMEDTIEVNGHRDSESDLDIERGHRRASGRKRKRDEEAAERAKAEKAAAARERPKQSKEYLKVLSDIEKVKARVERLEEKIADCDADLREANVQRTKVLGSDRFCNRYYWFERNGQPFAGLPTSSTAHYGYANGRLWVQGPDEMERAGFLDLPPHLQAEYKSKFRMTVPERRLAEEGATRLQSAQEWGYYDDPDRLDSLIAWLDERGDREKRLLRELREWRDEIARYMEARKKFFDDEAARKVEMDEEAATRVHTRHAIQKDRTAAAERCLKWHNSMAMTEMGHLHSSNPNKPRPKKQAKGVAVSLTNRGGRPRQASSYVAK